MAHDCGERTTERPCHQPLPEKKDNNEASKTQRKPPEENASAVFFVPWCRRG
jgi:hypothetical protein